MRRRRNGTGRGKGEEERGPNNKAIYHVAREERDLWMTAYSERGVRSARRSFTFKIGGRIKNFGIFEIAKRRRDIVGTLGRNQMQFIMVASSSYSTATLW